MENMGSTSLVEVNQTSVPDFEGILVDTCVCLIFYSLFPAGNSQNVNMHHLIDPFVEAMGPTALDLRANLTRNVANSIDDDVIVVESLLRLMDSATVVDDTNIKKNNTASSTTAPCVPDAWLAFRFFAYFCVKFSFVRFYNFVSN